MAKCSSIAAQSVRTPWPSFEPLYSPAPCVDGNSGQAGVYKDIASCWRWILGHGRYLLPSLTSLGEKLTFFKLAVGYVVKLSTAPVTIRKHDTDQCLVVHIPVNNILVGGA